MPCFHPIPGWWSKTVGESGKRGVVFSVNDGFKDMPVAVPCGNCIGCREVRERMWSVRCAHEARLHDLSWFVTLTYDDKCLPVDGGLSVRDWQLFMKRFRAAYGKVRFFMCGQYGEISLRPHYHALLFGVDFDDRRDYPSSSGQRLYVSVKLDECWGMGGVKFSPLSDATIRYVTAYMGRSVLDKGECLRRGISPEFQLMSRRPGLGSGWLDKYWMDVYPEDAVTTRGGVKLRPPRFYDEWLGKRNADMLYSLKVKRKERMRLDVDSTGSRLLAREGVAESRAATVSNSDPEG